MCLKEYTNINKCIFRCILSFKKLSYKLLWKVFLFSQLK